MHPDVATLVAYCDGELGEDRAGTVAAHVFACERCSTATERIFADWALARLLDADTRDRCAPPADGLSRLLSAIRERQEVTSLPEVKRRLGAELEVYFGEAAVAILDRIAQAPDFPRNVRETVGPLLTSFLGQKAGSAALAQIMEGAAAGC